MATNFGVVWIQTLAPTTSDKNGLLMSQVSWLILYKEPEKQEVRE